MIKRKLINPDNAYKEENWKYRKTRRDPFDAASELCDCDYTIKTFYI